MNGKQLLASAALLLTNLIVSGQFSTSFLAKEGYATGDLVSNPNWTGASNAFTVDTSGSGILKVDPNSLWEAAAYSGSGGTMSESHYTARSVFSLKFSNGASASITGALVLGLYEFRNASTFQEYAGFGLRQTEGSAKFNMFVINTLNGSNDTEFSSPIAAADLGIAKDGSGKWSDGASDVLELLYSLEFDGTQWNQSLTLINLSTRTTLISVSQSSMDNDGSFFEAARNFRLSTDKISENPVTVSIDRIDVAASNPIPEASPFVVIPEDPSAEPMVTVNPAEFPGALVNPLKGFRPDLGSRSLQHKYASLGRDYIRWSDIENDESDTLEKIIDYCNRKWAGIEAAGIKVIPRVYLDWDERTGNEYWPADLEDMDYTSEAFKQRLRRLIARLGKAWDNDPRVAWVQMGLIGRWGEHHNPYLSPEMESLLGEAFEAAFQNKKVLVRHADEFTDREVGYYWDSWAHIYQYDKAAHGAGIEHINKTTGRWKTHPIEGEVAYNWGNWQIQPGDDPDDTLSDPVHRDFLHDLIRKLHCSALGWVSEYNPGNPEVAEAAEMIQKAFGYRLLINELSCPKRTEPGGDFSLRFTVTNTGSAPFLEDWPVELSFLDPRTGRPVWRTVLENVDVRTWLPGTNWDNSADRYATPAAEYVVEQTVSLPHASDLPAGEYIVALAVVDPLGRQPALRFAITNYLKGGRHPFANVGIGVDAEIGHQLDPVGFDDPMEEGRLPYAVEPLSSFSLWSDIPVLADGWSETNWFGTFWRASHWIYHHKLGFLYKSGVFTSGFYLFSTSTATWFWSSDDVFPWIYEFGESGGWRHS